MAATRHHEENDMRITKRQYDRLGGMRNARLYRNEKGGRWYYYYKAEDDLQ